MFDLIHFISNRPLTDTAAILNLLVLRSIMGCPGGTCSRSVFMHAIVAKRELQCIFLGKEVIIIRSIANTAAQSFFTLQSFSTKT